MTCSPKNSMKASAPLSQSEQLFMTQARSGVLGITGIRYLEPFSYRYMVFFLIIRGLRILFFLDFGYSVHRHELNVYFSVEAALLAGSVLQF